MNFLSPILISIAVALAAQCFVGAIRGRVLTLGGQATLKKDPGHYLCHMGLAVFLCLALLGFTAESATARLLTDLVLSQFSNLSVYGISLNI